MSAVAPKTVNVDARGFVCPSSLLVALKELNKHKEGLQSGQIRVEFLIDNHDSTNRICEAVKSMGYTFAVTDEHNGYAIAVYKTRAMKDGTL